MPSNESLKAIKSQLTGYHIDIDAIKQLLHSIPNTSASRWYADAMVSYSLAGTTFILTDDKDLSELGVEMRWMSPEESLDEMINAYPGIAARMKGYIPVGICLTGSGDPYFIRTDKSDQVVLVRIPHDACQKEGLNEKMVEIICDNIDDFFLKASIE